MDRQLCSTRRLCERASGCLCFLPSTGRHACMLSGTPAHSTSMLLTLLLILLLLLLPTLTTGWRRRHCQGCWTDCRPHRVSCGDCSGGSKATGAICVHVLGQNYVGLCGVQQATCGGRVVAAYASESFQLCAHVPRVISGVFWGTVCRPQYSRDLLTLRCLYCTCCRPALLLHLSSVCHAAACVCLSYPTHPHTPTPRTDCCCSGQGCRCDRGNPRAPC